MKFILTAETPLREKCCPNIKVSSSQNMKEQNKRQNLKSEIYLP